jgi:hypothetical protein
VPLGNFSPESLTFPITPWLFPFLNPRPLLAGTVAAERKSGGASYRQWERSTGGSGEVWELLAVTSRGRLPTMMAGVGLAACAGGRARRRRVLQPAHDGRVQSNCTGSFIGGQWCCRRKGSKSGSPCSSVYVRRQSDEVWRRQFGTSGDVVLGSRARGASLSSGKASRGIGWGGGGLEWPVHSGRGSGGRWHTVRRARSGELAVGWG